ncbi:GAF and ANTAR domain-containing protein [Mobilicoccus massiliensis]|uniref:GAF and ANTAR domain-containing protein n=1 Tax=Mobilicoccus massiliensis TaxID=1522310 RepID=UPI0006935BD9|nr:GAF and ANTAR domain-containing protein [Mobilicoccus massiliensis]
MRSRLATRLPAFIASLGLPAFSRPWDGATRSFSSERVPREGGDRLDVVCRRAHLICPAVRGVVVTAHGTGMPWSVATDGSRRIGEVLETTGDGPGTTAWNTGLPVVVDDLRADPRWPGFTPLAADAGLAAVVAVPLQVRGQTLGTLSCLSDRVRSWETWSSELVLLTHLVVGAIVADAMELEDDSPAVGATQGSVTAAAAGVLAVRLGTSVEQAALLMRARAFSRGEPLHRMAENVVDGRTTLV